MKDTLFEHKEKVAVLAIAFMIMAFGVSISISDLQATNNNQLTGFAICTTPEGVEGPCLEEDTPPETETPPPETETPPPETETPPPKDTTAPFTIGDSIDSSFEEGATDFTEKGEPDPTRLSDQGYMAGFKAQYDYIQKQSSYFKDGSGAITQGLGWSSTWGRLGSALGWGGSEEDPWLPAMAAVGDYFDLDEWARSQCETPFDMNTPVNLLMTEGGDTVIMLEASKTYYEQYVACDNPDGTDNNTICEKAFPGQGIGCSEGICGEQYGQDIPTKSYKVYNIEVIFDGSDMWIYDDDGDIISAEDEGDIIFDIIMNPGAKKVDYDGDGNVSGLDNIKINDDNSSISKTGMNSIIFLDDSGGSDYQYACLKFEKTTTILEDLLDEYNDGVTGEFCTSFQLNPDRIDVPDLEKDITIPGQ